MIPFKKDKTVKKSKRIIAKFIKQHNQNK